MSRRLLYGYGVGAFLLSGALAGSISAVPLTYGVVTSESQVSASFNVVAGMDVSPDFTELLPPAGDDFPNFSVLNGASHTTPTSESKVIADVGLPGAFGNGSNGITFSDLSIVLQDLPGTLEGFGLVPVPLDITGSSIQLVSFFAHVSSFRIDLDSAFSSSLTPTGNPDEWLWAGLANVTISGELKPLVQIPTQGDFPLGNFPFSQQATIPLAGTFSGTSTHTRVAVGLEQGALQDLDLSLPFVNEQIDLLDLGLVTATFQLQDFTLADISTAIVYQNTTPIPEPGTGLLLGLGLVALAARRGRR